MPQTGELKVTTPSDREIAMSRVFDAPRALVWDAYTKPELVKRWLGVFGGWSLAVCDIDLRVGGAYRYLWRGPGGVEMGMRGVYREIVRPERIVSTERFDEPWYPGDAEDTIVFEERNGKTTATTTVRYASREARDGVLQSPMSKGVTAGYDTLDGVLAVELAAASGKAGAARTIERTIDVPRILQTAAQATAVIHVTVSRAEIRNVMGPGINELKATLEAQGIKATGSWFTHHFKFDPGMFDFEIGLPVAAPITPVGRVTNGQLPATTVARTIYHGPYEGLPDAWPQLDRWVVAQGRQPATWLWETYLTDPASNTDPATWQTELTRPLV